MRLRSARKNAAPGGTSSPRSRRGGPPTAHAPARVAARRGLAARAQAAGERKSDGGPQDRALYGCQCGSTFQAPVSASVRCPHCGDTQAW